MIKPLLFAAVILLAASDPTMLVPSYTTDQAAKGQILFYENCAECHGAELDGNYGPALSGPGGNVQWETVSYVWGYMTAHMPAGNANGLRPKEYVEIMAFLLKMHANPAGRKPLTAAAANASKAFMGQ
jgi:mono/diheme cytochrome c family protein